MRILSRLTPRRAVNGLLVWTSFYWSRWTKSPVHWGSPVSVSIEPTTACNLGCPECPSGLKQFTRATGNLKEGDFRNWIDQLAHTTSYVNFYFQGEPYIHPSFFELVKYARAKNLYTATSTNAHFLNEENARRTIESGLDRLIVSIDGTTQEVYEQYRVHGKLDKVLEGTRALLRLKKEMGSMTPHVIFQFLVVKPNEHQIEDVKNLAHELGVDEVRFKSAQVYDYERGNPLIPENEKYSRYRRKANGTYEVKNSLDNHCWRLWHSCVITWDGNVVPCCFDKDASHRMGSLRTHSFHSIWNNPDYRNFRASLLRSRSEIDICKNCSEGTKVWV